MDSTFAPCSSCTRNTTHQILHSVTQREEEAIDTYVMLECGGCHTISMGQQTTHLPNGEVEHTYYPSPVSRKKPSWVLYLKIGFIGKKGDEELGDLLDEIYQAVDGGQHRLAALGIRALLERVMVMKVGDLESFDKNLEAFHQRGFISGVQRDSMKTILEVGHAAMHRSYKPTARDLSTALEIVEGIFAPIFDQADAALGLAKRIPPRSSKAKTK
jgi:hypothetical protein